MLQKLKFKPGINREVSNYSNEGGWYKSDKIRFKSGLPEQIGGWTRVSANQYLGVARNLISWVALDGDRLTGVGTNIKYYIEEGGAYADITPVRATNANTTTFSATNGSAVITATDSSGHGAVLGDYVTISNAVSLGGLITAAVLNTEHRITGILSANSYTFTASATANASDSGNGGSATDAAYQLNTGPSEFSYTSGWSSGSWPDYLDATLGTDPFNVTAGSATVTVTHNSHGLDTGDYIYINSIGTSFLNGQQLRWQFTVGRNIGSSPNSSSASYGNGWPSIPQQNDNNQYSNYYNMWGFNTWDYIDNNDNSQILFNILDTTIRWPMVSTSGNYFYYENFVTGDNNPFGSPIITLNQDNEFQSAYSGGSLALGNYWNSYSNAVGAYTQLDLKMPFNPNFIFSPPSQATGYWTLNSPVYVYIFYQANPVFYTASNVTNPYGPDEDD